MKDLIIIGAGPAGITAAVYAARKRLDFTVITRDIGGQTNWAGDVENYTGYQYIPGPELAMKFREHLAKFSFDLKDGEDVVKIEQIPDGFKVTTKNNAAIATKTIIVASGKRPKLLGAPGEGKFKNKGLTYCATCEGPLFANKVVAVAGGGNSALDAVLQLIRFAAKVYLINAAAELSGDIVMQEKIRASSKVAIINNAQITQICGDKFVSSIKLTASGQPQEMTVEGVFVEIGLIPNSAIIDFVAKNADGEIIIDCAARTSVPGVFAAGDVTNVPEKQIVVAAGEGAKATLAVFRYLATHRL
ncbi:FAD-dependent oxidoreductase [Candidatus Saganbacteria bacterium]|nr:FAD-dependent oxidoreductase [Candidatus Saganbacteria bacterium]